MDRVLDRLYIGDARDLDGSVPLKSLGISAVVDLRDGAHANLDGVTTLRIKNRDGDAWTEKQVESVYAFITENVRSGKVVVACAAGMSRSASIVIGYLVRMGFEATVAHAMLRAARPNIRPVPAMLDAALGRST